MRYTYLLIDFFTIIVPFIFSFHPKLNFYKTWKAFFSAVFITGVIFILWDVCFTGLGVWGFNKAYVTGFYICSLPIEEILFFFCIPYACVFTYHCLDLFIEKNFSGKLERFVTPIFILLFFVLAIINHNKIYTVGTFIGLAALLIFAKYILKLSWLPKFYVIYTILLIPFIIVNGLLTGTGLAAPVVWYNSSEIIGLRLLSIPVEDIFYGMALILTNLIIYKHLISKKVIG